MAAVSVDEDQEFEDRAPWLRFLNVLRSVLATLRHDAHSGVGSL